MNYKSTRGNDKGKTAAEAIKMGLGADGGLFMPEEIPTLSAVSLALQSCLRK